ncbi:MAG: hypothetical protein F6J87_30950 [Spirulina sp. SIO3F2]|nr:hypothetical protein [Spirulina sp. SIO3F2]
MPSSEICPCFERQVAACAERLDLLLFGEVASQIIVSVAPPAQPEWDAYLNQVLADNWLVMGEVSASGELAIAQAEHTLIQLDVASLHEVWDAALVQKLRG